MNELSMICFIALLYVGAICFFIGPGNAYVRITDPDLFDKPQDKASFKSGYKSEKTEQEKRWEENAK